MSSRVLTILVSLILLYSLGIHEALAETPPLVPPLMQYGTAFVDNVPPAVDYTVSIKMELLLVIFFDGSDVGIQTLIGNIRTELESVSGGTGSLPSLQQAFQQSPYCQAQTPPILLSSNTRVDPDGSDWQVTDWDNDEKYTVKIDAVPQGNKLEVYQHNGVIASYDTTSDPPTNHPTFNYFVLIPLYPDGVLGGGDTYALREAGKAASGDKGYAYVNDIRATDIYINDTQVTDVTIDGQTDVMKLDIYAPSVREFSIDLVVGWNLISLPLQPENTDIDVVLLPIQAEFESVWAYDAGLPGWRLYDPTKPLLSDMGKMEAGIGYWVKMNLAGRLTIRGMLPASTIPLIVGWNLVGYNAQTSNTSANSMSSIAGQFESVWAYDPSLPGWRLYAPDKPLLSDMDFMGPGIGYWIEAKEVSNWDFAP